MITWLAILYFLIAQSLFNECAPPYSLGWSVFYYCSLWGSLIAISLEGYMREYSSIRRSSFLIAVIPMLFQLILHLSCINKSYEDWYRIADSRIFELIFIALIMVTSSIVIFRNRKLWVKNLRSLGK